MQIPTIQVIPTQPQVDTAVLLSIVVQFISQLKANGLTAGVIQAMKSSKWSMFSWINAETPHVARALGTVGAVATAVGINATFHGGTLIISGITAYAIVHGLWNIAQNYLMQHAWYKVIFQSMFPAAPAPVKP